jgi:hypothetical protein
VPFVRRCVAAIVEEKWLMVEPSRSSSEELRDRRRGSAFGCAVQWTGVISAGYLAPKSRSQNHGY